VQNPVVDIRQPQIDARDQREEKTHF
jgi:hypothetical protein